MHSEEDLTPSSSSSSSTTAKRCPSSQEDNDDDAEVNRPKRQRTIPQAMSHMEFSDSSETVTVQGNEVPSLIPYLKPFRTIVIDASYAAKKSFRIRELLQHVIDRKQNARILCLSVRIIHSYDMLAQLEDQFGFESYKDITTERDDKGELIRPLGSVDRLICSYESMHRLYNYKDVSDQPQYDVLILDEFRSLCDTMCKKGDMPDPQASEYLLKHFMRTAPTLVTADADTSYDNACKFALDGILPTNRARCTIKVLGNKLQRHLSIFFKGWHAQNSTAPDKHVH